MKNVDLLLINPPFHIRNGGGNFFPLGLGYIISSVIAHGYTWGIIDCSKIISNFSINELCEFEKNFRLEMHEYSPKLIGIGPCITSQLRALKIISGCCKTVFPAIPIVAGGPLASIEGQEWLFYDDLGIDFIIKGDGEHAISDALNAVINEGNIANSTMVSRKGYSFVNEISDINSILFPYRGFQDKNVFSTRRSVMDNQQNQAAMITSRGCPYSCRYCVSGNLSKSKRVRKRTVENIILEMEFLSKNYGISDIVFYDDCFFYNVKNSEADIKCFCEALINKKLNIFWQMELRPDLLLSLSDNSILLLENSGCRQINIGIEKISSEGLAFLGKANSIKGLKEKNLHIKNISKIKLSATFILGGGYENYDDVFRLIEESKNLGLDFAHYNPLFVYPGTPLYKDVFDDDKKWAEIIYNDTLPWGEIVFENEYLKCLDLIKLVDYAYSEFYKNTEFAEHQMVVDRFNIKE